MSKVVKGFGIGVAVIALALVPACRSKKTVAPKVAPAETQPPIVVPPPPPPPTTTVSTETDFVRTETTATEPKVTATTLPANVEELNRLAQDRGYIQDAFFGYDESTLTPEAQGALTVSANWLKQNPQYNILIEGHCDERGT